MPLNAINVRYIYESDLATRYDRSMDHFFTRFKKAAFDASSLKKGDRVVVFCCGSGLDFLNILEKIGPEGSIIGIDFSSRMLQQAKEKIEQNGWRNIRLIQADVTNFENKLSIKADVGVCTLGLSVIPSFMKAYRNLLSNVRENGEIIIGDMQLASGWKSVFNLFTIHLSKKYGGSKEGHRNSLEIIKAMHHDLIDIKKGHFFLGAYYYFVGRKKLE